VICEARRIWSHLLTPRPSGTPPVPYPIVPHESRTTTTLFMARLCSLDEQITGSHGIAWQPRPNGRPGCWVFQHPATDGEWSEVSGVELLPHKQRIRRTGFPQKQNGASPAPLHDPYRPAPPPHRQDAGRSPFCWWSTLWGGRPNITSSWCRRRRSCLWVSRPCSRPRLRHWIRSSSRRSRSRTSRSP